MLLRCHAALPPTVSAPHRIVCRARIVIVLVLGATASSLAAVPQVPRDVPFLYKGPGPWRERFAPERLRAWLAAVERHQPGRPDDVSRTVAGWSHRDVTGAVADFDALESAIRKRLGSDPPSTAPALSIEVRGWRATVADAMALLHLANRESTQFGTARLVQRAAMLHTDVAIAEWDRSSRADAWSSSPNTSFHLGVANVLVDRLRRDRANVFVRRWYIAVAAVLQARQEVTVQPSFLQRALSILGNDPALLVMAGSVHELRASPRMDLAPSSQRIRLVKGDQLRRAEGFYRRALREDDGLVEARLRLAHVLGEMGRHADAVAELTRVPTESVDLWVAYCAQLALGQQEEALGRFEAARRAYGEALRVSPHAHSAHLALSHLARRQGDRAAAAARLGDVLRWPAQKDDDPWRDYHIAGYGRHVDRLLVELRRSGGEGPAQ